MSGKNAGQDGVIADAPDGVTFGRKAAGSIYDQRLLDLERAGDGKVLVFQRPSCKPSVSARAKKLGLAVEFGEYQGKLYVRLKPALKSVRESSPPPTVGSTAEAIREAIAKGADSNAKIVTRLRSDRITAYPSSVDAILVSLVRRNIIALKDKKGPEGEDLYRIRP